MKIGSLVKIKNHRQLLECGFEYRYDDVYKKHIYIKNLYVFPWMKKYLNSIKKVISLPENPFGVLMTVSIPESQVHIDMLEEIVTPLTKLLYSNEHE